MFFLFRLKLNEQDHDYPNSHHKIGPLHEQTHYDRLMADAHGRIKDPTTYYQHPEPQKGSIIYADNEFDKKPMTSKVLVGRPETSKIDENGVLNIGQNYGKVKHIQEQLNSMKRQFPGSDSGEITVGYDKAPKFEEYHHMNQHMNQHDNAPKFEEYHHMNPMNQHMNPMNQQVNHHMNHMTHHMSNSHFGNNYEPNFGHHLEFPSHYGRQPIIEEHYRPPVIIEDSPPIHIEHQPMHIQNQQPAILNHPNLYSPVPEGPQPRKNSMEFNGFYSNFYNSLPPAKPPAYSPFKK